MTPDEVNALWHKAIRAKAKLADELFQRGAKVTPDDMVAVALFHPEKFDILVQLKEGQHDH